MSVALLRPYSSLDYLDTPELRAEYLAAAVEEGDPGVIAQARALLGNTAAPSPPPVNDLWRIPAILAIVGAIVLWVHLFIPQPAKAETIGYRIEAEACRGTVCRPLIASPRVWGGLYACQGRAANISRFGLPGDRREIRARCTAIDGMPSA